MPQIIVAVIRFFMKNSLLVLAAIFLTHSAHAEAIQGVQYLQAWAGTYAVTECTQCSDIKLDTGEDLKNLSEVGIGVFSVDPNDALQCSQTNYNLGFDYEVSANNGIPNNGSSISWGSGQCDWNSPSPHFGESLTVTADSFDYESKNSTRSVQLILKKLPDGSYQINRHETDSSPSWGLPTDWSFQVKATKSP